MASIFIFLAALLAPSWVHAQPLECLTVGISDGDTIKVRCGEQGSYEQLTVRFGGIDAPEQKQPFGQSSKQALSDLIYMKTVQLDCYKTDRYRRNICNVSTKEHGDIGLAMIRLGMAWWYRDYAKEQTADARRSYEQAETVSKKEMQGLWSDSHAMSPWEWRREKRS